jgi:nicotinate-nucleotide adenylyltransferase
VRIALFGGSFNPPHVAHQLVCTVALATARPELDRVWMVPTYRHPFEKELAPFEERFAMCRAAAEPFAGRVEVSKIEKELGGSSYTLHTVRALTARHPEHQFVVVIGADLLPERVRWHGWEELQQLVPFLVVGRAGISDAAGALALPAVSSTEVRERLATGRSVEGLVPAKVIDHIHAQGLYGA